MQKPTNGRTKIFNLKVMNCVGILPNTHHLTLHTPSYLAHTHRHTDTHTPTHTPPPPSILAHTHTPTILHGTHTHTHTPHTDTPHTPHTDTLMMFLSSMQTMPLKPIMVNAGGLISSGVRGELV